MNIGIITPHFPHPEKSGSQIRLFHIIRYLSAHHSIHLINLDPHCTATEEQELRPYMASFKSLPSQRYSALSRICSILCGHPFTANKLRATEIANFFESAECDVMVAVKTSGAYYATEAKVCAGKAFIVEEGCMHHLYYERQWKTARSPGARFQAFVRWIKMRRYERTLLGRCTAVTAVSDREAQVMHGMDQGATVWIVPNGVDASFFRPKQKPVICRNVPFVAFCGSYGYKPNAEAASFILQEIMPLLDPSIHVYIAGNNPLPRWHALAQNNKRIHITGFVDDIRPLISQALAFINPMMGGGGTRLKVLHAMALQCPVISTLTGAEGIGYRRDRDILIASGAADFANRIHELLHDPAHKTRIGRSGRKLVEERYDWKAVLSGLGTNLENCLRV